MNRHLECARCGLAPVDLPDGVDPEVIFETGPDGQIYDEGCLSVVESGRELGGH